MIGISTITADPNGARYFNRHQLHEPQRLRSASRRASRVATLDGGVAVYDTGYAPGDRWLTVQFSQDTLDLADWLKHLVRHYGQVLVATGEGCFLAVPQHYAHDQHLQLRLMIVAETTNT